MSVWVEMFSSGKTQQGAFVTLHVSVWVEIIISEKMILWKSTVTLHVSVWVEIQCYFKEAYPDEESRSTWACELKCLWFGKGKIWGERHAPRERVSWNTQHRMRSQSARSHAPRERVSWNNKYTFGTYPHHGHAPRERVSWNCFQLWF